MFICKQEWLFTTTPRMFGLIPGCACLTGWALVLVLAIMFVFSLPFVRKSGSFEVSFEDDGMMMNYDLKFSLFK